MSNILHSLSNKPNTDEKKRKVITKKKDCCLWVCGCVFRKRKPYHAIQVWKGIRVNNGNFLFFHSFSFRSCLYILVSNQT